MMKISTFLVPFLLFLLSTQSLPSATAATDDDVVYDIAGEKVRKDKTYRIEPVLWAMGGGVKIQDTKNGVKICPFNIVQDPSEVVQGDAFFFTPVSSSGETYVRVLYPLGVDSGIPKGTCDKSTFWKIEDPEANAPSNFVTTGGEFEAQESCFQVVKHPNPTIAQVQSYMLQHCPMFCGAPPQPCYNVSIYNDGDTRHLASSGTPFEFVFRKATLQSSYII